jgi:hypothetical protein
MITLLIKKIFSVYTEEIKSGWNCLSILLTYSLLVWNFFYYYNRRLSDSRKKFVNRQAVDGTGREEQSIKKERTHQLNSKFDNTYQIFFLKILSLFDIRRKSQFIWITNDLYNKSFHYFYKKTCFHCKGMSSIYFKICDNSVFKPLFL